MKKRKGEAILSSPYQIEAAGKNIKRGRGEGDGNSGKKSRLKENRGGEE